MCMLTIDNPPLAYYLCLFSNLILAFGLIGENMKYLNRQLIHYTVFHVLLLLLILNKNYNQPIFLNPILYKPGYSSSEAPAKRVILYLLEDVGVEEVRVQKNYNHCQFFHKHTYFIYMDI